jgi:hypothetical protein
MKSQSNDDGDAKPPKSTSASIALQFRQWIKDRPGISPLYETIVDGFVTDSGLAKDEELLRLIGDAKNRDFIYNRFMGAVHFLLLKGTSHPLMNYYATVTHAAKPPTDVYPHFRDFCFLHKNEILQLMEHEVQINEVRRCSAFLPAFTWIAQQNSNRPLALLDVGACAGLNLLLDRYFFDFGLAGTVGDPKAPVKIYCKLRGIKLPPLPDEMLSIAWRLGIDRAPIDVTNSDATNWLIAFVSPDDKSRLAFLQAALNNARCNPPPIIKGDACEQLLSALLKAPQNTTLCVFHSFTMQDLGEKGEDKIKKFDEILNEFAKRRDFYLVSLEWERINGQPQKQKPIPLKAVSFINGTRKENLLGLFDNRGVCEWIEWLQTS